MLDTFDYSPQPKTILDRILASDAIDLDGFRLSLWSGFYTAPVFAAIERTYGLLRDESNILFCLTHYGPMTAKSACDVLGRPKNSISRAVENLLRRDLIGREQVKSDRRRALLSIKPAGLRLGRAAMELFMARQDDMLRCLSPVERVALDGILAKLMAHADTWLGPA